jgi:hypothetical protein
MLIRRLKAKCPNCLAKTGVLIAYGFPGDTLLSAAYTNRVVLGGCVITPDKPHRACLRCGHRWRLYHNTYSE